MVLVNGVEADVISVMDRGLAYGDGFFETFYCIDGLLQNWIFHWERMKRSAGVLKMDLPSETEFLCDFDALKNLENRTERDFVVKIIVTRGVGGRGYSIQGADSANRIIFSSQMPDYKSLRSKGMDVSFLNFRLNAEGPVAGLKHLNRIGQVFAKIELDETGNDEGIVCDSDGFVIEGVSSNIFIVSGNEIITPHLQHCGVKGVLRKKVIETAFDISGAKVLEESLKPEDIRSADSIFFTNSLLGVCPVRKLEGQTFETDGDILKCLMDASLQSDSVVY